MQYLKTEPGLKVELVASEPMVVSPVAVAWDEKGRMFVVEDRGYPIGPGKGKPPVGQVVLLEDTNGDGKYDKRTVFADGLTFPNGVMPWKGGVYVTCAPYLYYFKDTNDDGVADIKEIVFKGFQDLSTTQLRVSHPTLNLDNWVYLTSGLTAAKVTAPRHPEKPAVFLNQVDGRFRPGTEDLEETTGMAQFGQSFDNFGRKFICSNRNHIREVVMQSKYLRRNPHLPFGRQVEDIPDHEAACRVYPLSANITTAAFHAGYITSACGITLFYGSGLPAAYNGNSFVCEPAGNLVHRDVLSGDGVTRIASRAFPTNEFLASPDNWFRPVNLANGPDGALYVCDMYRKTIEHPDYLPEATRKITDFESGKTMGRIYRITAADAPRRKPRPFDLSKAPLIALCQEFNSSNIWGRMTAQRLLIEMHDLDAVPYLQTLATKGKTPEARVHALRTLEALGALDNDQIAAAIKDRDPGVREHSLQLAEDRAPRSPALAAGMLSLADDPNPRVRFQCAVSLGSLDDDRIIPALAKIAARGLDDKWTREAALSSINHRELPFLHQLLAETASAPSESLSAMMAELGQMLAEATPSNQLSSVLQELLSSRGSPALPQQTAGVSGFGDGLRARGLESSTLHSIQETSPELREGLAALFKNSTIVAADSKQPVKYRQAAISLLGQAGSEAASTTLVSLLDPRQPAEIQTTAVHALSRMPDPAIGSALVSNERWNAYSPAMRDAVLSVIMGNPAFIHTLLAAVEKGGVPPLTINEDRRTQLMRHKDQAIKEKALALFKDIQPSDRMKIYEETKSVLVLTGNSKNGHAVFQKNCTACHVVSGEGHLVGPDLTGIRNQPKDVLLLHIVVPEYEIMPIYTCYNVETKDGQTFTGLLASETPAAITLRMSQGIEQQIPRGNIAGMIASRLSLMPQELEKAMTRQDLADLLSFLKGE